MVGALSDHNGMHRFITTTSTGTAIGSLVVAAY